MFDNLGLAEPLLKALASEGYTRPTPIQAQAIPALLAGRDLMGLAQTGTGKTAAFALPILQRLAASRVPAAARTPRALVLAPTRELALQIGQSFTTYGRNLRVSNTVILGGVGIGPQIRALARGVDILIATPGRLLDLVGGRHVRLDRVEHVVLDEADRMFDMGFIRDVRKIIALLPRKRQTLLFSATMPAEIRVLASEILVEPQRVEIAPRVVTVECIEQQVYFVGQSQKRVLLDRLLSDGTLARVIVFTRTKHRANRVADQLVRGGVATEALHGNKSQNARQRALERFRTGAARVLVATDIAARGIDVDGVTHVINFELPNEPESYVHRVGRTGRAGAGGTAISLCDPSERAFLRDIERLTRRPMAVLEAGPLPEAAKSSGGRSDKPRNGSGGRTWQQRSAGARRRSSGHGARRAA